MDRGSFCCLLEVSCVTRVYCSLLKNVIDYCLCFHMRDVIYFNKHGLPRNYTRHLHSQTLDSQS